MAAVIISLFVLPPVHAQRQTQTINDSWKFLKGECTAAADSAFDDSKWTSIHLPHTWNTDAYTEKDYYRGTGWYRRQLTLAVRYSRVLQEQNLSKLILLYNTVQFKKAADTYECDSLLLFTYSPHLSVRP